MYDYRIPIVSLLLFVCLVHVCCTEDSLPQYKCHEDHCNLYGQPQFCSTTYERCRNCQDIKEKCATPEQPLNCTKFCVDLEVNKQVNEEKEKDCKPLGQITGGRYNGSSNSSVKQGDVIKVTCHPNYIMPLGSLYTCGQYGLWKPIEPKCFFSGSKENIDYKTATVCLAIFCGVCLMVLIVTTYKCLKYKSKCQRATDKLKDAIEAKKAEKPGQHHVDKSKQTQYELAATRSLEPREDQPFLEETEQDKTTEPKTQIEAEDESARNIPVGSEQSRGVSSTHGGINDTNQTRGSSNQNIVNEQQSVAQLSSPQQELAQPRPELPQFDQHKQHVATPIRGQHPHCAPSTLCVPDSSSGFPPLADVGNHNPDTPEQAGGKFAISTRNIDLDDMKGKNYLV